MWKRKSEAEIHRVSKELARDKKSPIWPLGLAALSVLIAVPLAVIFGTKSHQPFEIGDWLISLAIVVFIFVFVTCYLLQLAYGRNPFKDEYASVLCEKCQKLYDLRNKKCVCGSKLEPVEFFDRVEN